MRAFFLTTESVNTINNTKDLRRLKWQLLELTVSEMVM